MALSVSSFLDLFVVRDYMVIMIILLFNFRALIEAAIGVPVLVFVFGALVIWVGRWVAKGFRPSQPQAGE